MNKRKLNFSESISHQITEQTKIDVLIKPTTTDTKIRFSLTTI